MVFLNGTTQRPWGWRAAGGAEEAGPKLGSSRRSSAVLMNTQAKFPSAIVTFFFNPFWLCWVFLATCRLSLVAVGRGSSLLRVCWASHCNGFSYCGARL